MKIKIKIFLFLLVMGSSLCLVCRQKTARDYPLRPVAFTQIQEKPELHFILLNFLI
ncbi:MAG: hypothetical protein WCC06_06620 [Candidatus Aminicenantales bacterium]